MTLQAKTSRRKFLRSRTASHSNGSAHDLTNPSTQTDNAAEQNTGSISVSDIAKPIVILFSDDSTLFFATRMRNVLLQAVPTLTVRLAWYYEETALSYRQMAMLLPEGPEQILHERDLMAMVKSDKIAAIITSRVYRPLGDTIKEPMFRLQGQRPCVVAFLGGLDFFPLVGFERRRNCDSIFLFPQSDITRYKAEAEANSWDASWQEVGFGHPTFLRPTGTPADLDDRRDIYFFTQALSPSTYRSRRHMLQAMIAMARRHRDYKVWIKLRHLPNENRQHLHLERFDYPGLLAEMTDVPENLKLTACTMDEALETAALGITCTSTAAIDVIRAGIPAMVHLDYIDNYCDRLVEPMREVFETSGLITSLDDMLNLRHAPPNKAWLENLLCPHDLGERVLETIIRFHSRPFQLPKSRVK